MQQRELDEIRDEGRDPASAERQWELLQRGPAPMVLERACTVGDGIVRLDETEVAEAAGELAAEAGRLEAFVPASGAASRLFAALNRLLREDGPIRVADLEARAGDEPWLVPAVEMLREPERLAVWDDLPGRAALGDRDLRPVLEALLVERRVAELPKGLLPFHRYDGEVRTAAQEHVREALELGVRRLHFTVRPEHLERWAEHLRDVPLEVSFSVQDPATDTIALDAQGRLFRDDAGRILFRPGGHGALLRNLADFASDIVLVKNIDNIVPDRHRDEVVRWRRRLVGLAVELQEAMHESVGRLALGGVEAVDEAVALLRTRFGLTPPPGADQAAWAAERLDRPLRVCGMVRDTGEPGGGPFWVRSADGVTPQIVEGAQIDRSDPRHREVLAGATHFNPVDMVCAVRDRQGARYHLESFVDDEAVLVTRKTHEGRPLTAIEHPGLWNGGMARWATVFVEVPAGIFHPVKTLADLLKPGHTA